MLSRIRPYILRRISYSRLHLPVLKKHNHRFFSSSDSNKAEFFQDNGSDSATRSKTFVPTDLPDFLVHKDELRVRLKEFYESRTGAISIPSFSRPLTIEQSEIEKLLLANSYAEVDSFREIAESSDTLPPIPGSVISFRDPTQGSVKYGIVIQEALSKFNSTYNKLVVLSQDNTFEYVYTQNVLLHLHGVVDAEWVKSLLILENRHDPGYYNREVLTNILSLLANKSLEFQELIQGPQRLLDVVYAQNCTKEYMTSKTMWEIADAIVLDQYQHEEVYFTYFTQCCFYKAVYDTISCKHDKFLIPETFSWLGSSNVSHGFSNNLVKAPQVLLLPSHLVETIASFLDAVHSPQRLTELNMFLNIFTAEQKASPPRRSRIDLHAYYSTAQDREFNIIIDIIKHQIIYPRDDISEGLRKLTVLKNDVSRENLIAYLQQIGVYDKNTDFFTSLQLWGRNKIINKVSMTRDESLRPKQIASLAKEDIAKEELFEYLMQDRFGADDIIYAFDVGSLRVGVSLQQINSRNYNISVHFPSLVTKLPPKSGSFSQMAKFSHKQESTASSSPTFDQETLESLQFNDQLIEEPANDFRLVGDLDWEPKKKKFENNIRPLSSLTLSFKYNTYESNSFKDIKDKIRFSYNDISRVPIKVLDADTLETALKGKSKTLSFTLFRSKPDQESNQLDNNDYRNLGFINQALKDHFWVRNFNGASTILADSPNNRVQFFLNELDKFVSNLTAEYCKIYQIPVFREVQGLLVEAESMDPAADEVWVRHNNFLLPNFQVSSYFQTLISRDGDGIVSLPAYLIGKNYLSRPKITTSEAKNVPGGLDQGYIPMMEPADSFAVFMNHLQILNNLHSMFVAKELMTADVDEYELDMAFSYLKGNGYNVHGPFPASVLEKHLTNLTNARQLNQFITTVVHKYRTLQDLEKRLRETTYSDAEDLSFDCVVTDAGYNLPDSYSTIYKCFVKQLNVEVEILSARDNSTTIGTVLKSNEVLLLDPARLVCVLAEAPEF